MTDLFPPPPLDQWPEALRVLFEERWAIRHFDGGMPIDDARDAAMKEIWGGQKR